jgi:hypothetical protein
MAPALKRTAPKIGPGSSLMTSTSQREATPSNVTGRGRMIVLLGAPGIGKTSFCAQMPGTYWLLDPTEMGILDLIESGQVRNVNENQVRKLRGDFNETLKVLDDMLYNPTMPIDTKTIVIESILGFENQCIRTCCDVDFEGKMHNHAGGYQFYQKGDRAVADNYWPKFTSRYLALREAGYNIILTGHTKTGTEKNAKGHDYLKEQARSSGPAWSVTDYIFENVFILNFEVIADKENDFARGKAEAEANRYLYCHTNPFNCAKNRMGITEKILANEGPAKLYRDWCHAANLDPRTLRFIRK